MTYFNTQRSVTPHITKENWHYLKFVTKYTEFIEFSYFFLEFSMKIIVTPKNMNLCYKFTESHFWALLIIVVNCIKWKSDTRVTPKKSFGFCYSQFCRYCKLF